MRIKKIKIILLIIVFGIFCLLFFSGSFLKNSFHKIFQNQEQAVLQANQETVNFLTYLWNRKQIISENQALKAENFQLLSEKQALQEKEKENSALRQALGLQEERGFYFIVADTIAFGSLNQSLIINKGALDGIKENMPALTVSGALLGKVGLVLKNFSYINLITFEKENFDIIIQTQDGETLALAEGLGGAKIQFNFAPKDKEIKTGDLVFTSLLSGKFPKGIVVGEVVNVSENSAGAFQQGAIKPFFPETGVVRVFLISNFNVLEQNDL